MLVVLAVVVTGLVAAPQAAPAEGEPAGLTALTSAPQALNLPFAADRTDYVIRCVGNQATTLTGSVGPGRVVRLRPNGADPSPPTVAGGTFEVVLRPPDIRGVRIDVTTPTSTRPLASYWVRCLTAGFPSYTASVTGTPQGEYYLVNKGHFVIVFNAEGTPVWWNNDAWATLNAHVVDGLLLSGVYGVDGCPSSPQGAVYRLRRWDGTVVRRFDHELDNHDLVLQPDGSVLGIQCVTSGRGLEEEARLVRLDADDQETWSWRTEDHIAPEEQVAAPWKFGFAHMNSIEPDGDSAVLVSPRNLDAVYDIDLATGAIRWKLGGTPTPASLTVSVGEDDLTEAQIEDLFSGQHDARILPDGTVTVFDNGTDGEGRLPRLLRFAIDLEARHATLLEEVRDPRVQYSWGLGSARRLSGGNWAASWGGPHTFVSEVDPTGAPVLTITGMSGAYRFVPVEDGEIDDLDLREGMDARMGMPNPSVAITVPAEGATYARGEEVASDFGCADQSNGSGITACVGDATVDTSTVGSHSFVVTATDGAGNQTTRTHTYTVEDRTDPTITITTPANDALYAHGEEVTADFACGDDTEIATCHGDTTVDTSTLGSHTFVVTATDGAGNQTTRTHTYTVEDRTDPTITITTPAHDALYAHGEEVTADFACDDDTEIATCQGDTTVDTSTLGSHTFVVTATDGAGNQTTRTHTYTVAPPRPDARIRTAPASFLGDDVYGGVQERMQRAQPGATAVFLVSAQNDAPFPDRLVVRGGGSTPRFLVRYLVAGRDVTRAVVAGTHQTPELAPGRAQAVQVRVTVRPSAAAGSELVRRVVVGSTRDPSPSDAVRIRTQRRS